MSKIALLLAFVVALVCVGCSPTDPLLDDFYPLNIYPSENNTYDLGSDDYTWAEGWFNHIFGEAIESGNITLSSTAPLRLVDDARVWYEIRPGLDITSIVGHGKPTQVYRGIYEGFSLPIWNAGVNVDEELYLELCVPNKWTRPAWQFVGDTGDEPGGMAVHDGLLWYPCRGDDTVEYYDGSTITVSGTTGAGPSYVYLFGGSLYVSCRGDDEVWIYNGTAWVHNGNVDDRPVGFAEFDGDLYVACYGDDTVWVYSDGVWALSGNVGDGPQFLKAYDGDLYVTCDLDNTVWVWNGAAWALDDTIGDSPQELHAHNGDLYTVCEDDDTVWVRTGGVWAIATNILTTLDSAPIGLEEFGGDLFTACQGSIWADIGDFWNLNSDFDTDQPMFLFNYDGDLYCTCFVGDGLWFYEGETGWIDLHCWTKDIQGADDAFRIEISYENYTPGDDIVPSSDDIVVIEVFTGGTAVYRSYHVYFPLNMYDMVEDDSVALRIRRIASSDEIVGEVVIEHIGLEFLTDKIGGNTL